MKYLVLTLTLVGALAFFETPAEAGDNYYAGWGHGAVHHAQDHARLNHQAQRRAAVHHGAHHYPLSYRQHAGLHRQLNHQAAHDAERHHVAHDSGRYYGGRRVSVRIGTVPFYLGY